MRSMIRSIMTASYRMADDPSQIQGADGGRVGAFLDEASHIIISFLGTLLHDFGGIIGCVFGLAVEVLRRTRRLVHLALQFRPGVSGYRAKSLLDFSAQVSRGPSNTIVGHDHLLCVWNMNPQVGSLFIVKQSAVLSIWPSAEAARIAHLRSYFFSSISVPSLRIAG